MSTRHPPKPCAWSCPWKGTDMCAQCLLNSQSLADQRVSLGVLYGLKSLYQAMDLPPCIVGSRIDLSGPRMAATALTASMA